MKEIREAVEHFKPMILQFPERFEKDYIHFRVLLDLAEKVLAVKMPEKKKHSDWDCGDAHCIVCEDRGYNRAIDDCRIAIIGALLSEKEGLKRFIDYGERLCNACIDADMQEDYEEVRYFKLELDKYKAQMEKLGGVR